MASSNVHSGIEIKLLACVISPSTNCSTPSCVVTSTVAQPFCFPLSDQSESLTVLNGGVKSVDIVEQCGRHSRSVVDPRLGSLDDVIGIVVLYRQGACNHEMQSVTSTVARSNGWQRHIFWDSIVCLADATARPLFWLEDTRAARILTRCTNNGSRYVALLREPPSACALCG